MELDFNNNMPIYIQLVDQIKISIISGKLKCGERLPSVRELALQLKVNPNTLQKALFDLEEQGLLFTERTNGKFVTEDSKIITRHKEEYAREMAIKYSLGMKNIGFNIKEAVKYLEKIEGDK